MTVQPPPIYDQVVNLEDGKAKLSWTLFFNQLFDGDAGLSWTPTFVNLTEVGTPTFTGTYYRLSKYLTLFTVTVTPSTSTSSVAGTTYIDNYPLDFAGDGFVLAMSGGTGSGSGHVVSASNRIYTPEWNAVTSPLTLMGVATT